MIPVELSAKPRAAGAKRRAHDPHDERLNPRLPRHIQIEVTGACNLRCHMCLVRYRPPINRVTGSLPFEDFTRLIDGLPGLERLTLQGLGEPLLHPRLVDMVEYASARGVRAGFNSNATLFTEVTCERLIRAGLGWLHISVDGSTAATYEHIRDGANFEKMCRNVRRLVDAKRRLGTHDPDLRVVFVAMRSNIDELPGVVRLAADWGIPDVRVQNLSHTFDDTDPAGAYQPIRQFAADEALFGLADMVRAEAAFEAASREAACAGIDLRLPRLEASQRDGASDPGQPGCTWPWESAYITHDGWVQPCCMVMGSDRVEMGQLRTTPFTDVWRNDAYRSFRSALLSSDPPAVCGGCSMYRGLF